MTKFSSLKKVIPQKKKRERSQPLWRLKQRVGILEKHKDYKVRARKTHQVEEQKKLLNEQIKNKNKEEYYIDMSHAHKTDKGITIVEKLPPLKVKKEAINNLQKPKKEQVKYIKQNATKNLNLLKMKLSMIEKTIEKYRKSLGFLESSSSTDKKSKHKIFLKSEEELKNFDPVEYFDTDPNLIENKHNRLKRKTLAEQSIKSYAPNVNIEDTTTQQNIDNVTIEAYRKLEKYLLKKEEVEEAIKEIEMALQIAIRKDKIEKLEKDESKVNKALQEDYKHVKYVQFKKERKR